MLLGLPKTIHASWFTLNQTGLLITWNQTGSLVYLESDRLLDYLEPDRLLVAPGHLSVQHLVAAYVKLTQHRLHHLGLHMFKVGKEKFIL